MVTMKDLTEGRRSRRYGIGKYPETKPATLEQVQQVVAVIEQGHTLAAACRILGIRPDTLYLVLDQSPEVQEVVARARRVAADTLAEEAVTVTDTEPDPRRARARSDARKWAAEMADRRRYGRQLDLNVTTHVDVAGPLAEARARARLRPVSDHEALDAEIVEEKSRTYVAGSADYQSADAVPALDIFE